ncbi:DUF1775 domain-containing protein [Aquabacter spiritensis]|uniref:YncI copper-binding domain-containing protein n=1 Tax=Aquabacter spiritensis TaxID=933073 RepID=A0A4V2UYP7_9HYPH|nr:DUF1775 domain-containing protein [Aquabacter spiritensis]TCT08168.1 hypothetical protein EDC64_101690 [Aquabacter spiritensis]
MSGSILRGALCAAALLSAAPAFAHVTLDQQQATSGTFYKAVLKVPHGCGTAATTAISVTLPEGVVSAKPQPKPGWTLATETGPYAKAYEVMHGPPVSQGVKTITWSGGDLPNAYYDEFAFIAYLTPQANPTTLYFPVVQSCGSSAAEKWTELPTAGAPRPARPAPALKLAAAALPAGSVKIGDLVVAGPWTRATPGGAKVAGGFLTITNSGTAPDRLVGGSFARAGRFEVHEMAVKDGIMTMRPLASGLEIAPGQTVSLAPGGFHLMFMDLNQPLKEGEAVKGTLVFEKAGTLDLAFQVRGIGAGAPSGGGMEHKH